jgi:hypothetical protein
MPFLALESLSFSGLAWTLKFLQANTQQTVFGMQGHIPVHPTDQCVCVCVG